MSQESLADKARVKLSTLRDIETGKRRPRFQTVRKLAQALDTTPEDLIPDAFECSAARLDDQVVDIRIGDDFESVRGLNDFGIAKCCHSPHDRISDYKNVLLEATGDIFISGTSMISISEDSADILAEKACDGSKIRLLIIDPDWIRDNCTLLAFLPNATMQQHFHLEVLNSIAKFQALYDSLPKAFRKNLLLKSYRVFFPYIVTGYCTPQTGKCVVEITDYLPQKERPRFTLVNRGEDPLFEIVSMKFNALWESEMTKPIFV